MGVIRSILLLAGVVSSVAFAYFIGHALSTGHGQPVVAGTIALGIGVALLTVFHKTAPANGTADSHH